MAGIYAVQINGIEAIIALLKSAPAISKPILEDAIVSSSAVLAKNTTTGNVPYRTGFLIQSFRPDLSTPLMARWFPTAKYAGWVNDGTDPHFIIPVNRKALFWPGASHPIRGVKHPGSKANPYMARIRDASTPEVNDLFKQAIDLITRKLSTQE